MAWKQYYLACIEVGFLGKEGESYEMLEEIERE